ncbi:D-aminoacyl-tRNA deacylase [Archaeoglobus veneficus]|uniref:D-aminoacyl-tRNA deacylase n=1 Tax=Archaeoglobus veneficus (strain DSM 11195 / SNP6) TaxID=693661 RepID=F2KSL3_ARCVS|nr:D-aminoacyl-tRNA deacylase [Archaeoglobus veneficus]AEA48083.1 D-tyrosyl-tRNA(Tyr) deacylase [Archaeoglobus veneficus SNP6]
MKLIVCSKVDLASQNIKDRLLEMLDAERKVLKSGVFYDAGDIGIIEVEERLIYADYLDERLKKELDFNEILFASRHSSKDGRKLLSVHVSGNVATADFGGKPYSLAKPAPQTIKNYVLALKEKLERVSDYTFSLEVTHHGPSEISTPSAFYEIGSTEEAWKDEEVARVVAEAMLEAINAEKRDWPVAVGVGGTHYAPRQTEIILETTLTFGHNFAKYTFDGLNSEILAKAIELSEAEYILIDEKSVTSRIKKLVAEVSDVTGVPVIKSKNAKREFTLH